MVGTMGLFSRNEMTRRDLAAAGERAGLVVVDLTGDPVQLAQIAGSSTAVRAPGGLVGAAIAAGARLALSGPTASWFTELPIEITGRRWHRLNVMQARTFISQHAPAMVKLADAKVPALPARRYESVDDFDDAVGSVAAGPALELLATDGWLDIVSEYRVFTEGPDALTSSPYLIEDETWSPILHTHRGSHHEQAADYVSSVLKALPAGRVPPAAAIDVARLADGRFIILEANQSWSAGPYGCEPDAVLRSVLAANRAADTRWRWRPPIDLDPTPR